MEIIIFTQRFDEYASLFSAYYSRDVKFRCIGDLSGLSGIADVSGRAVIIADPHMLEGGGASALFAHQGTEWPEIIIGGPDSVSSIKKELRSIESLKEECPVSEADVREGNAEAAGKVRGRNIRSPEREDEQERTAVGITGLSRGAGASFITLILAEALASEAAGMGKQITVLSVDDSYIYDALGMERRFRAGAFTDVYIMRDGSHVMRPNVDEDISWAVSAPDSESRKLLPGEKACIARIIPGNYILWDMGYDDFDFTLRQARSSLDLLILVIDPLPSAMIGGMKRLTDIKGSGIPVLTVFNKWNKGVDAEAALDFAGCEDYITVPMADASLIYRAEYECENPYRNPEIRRTVSDAVRNLTGKIMNKKPAGYERLHRQF